jgi:Putative silver efflux pump
MDKFPEIVHVVAKIGTAEVPTDPMAVEDADIMIVMKPFKEWTSASRPGGDGSKNEGRSWRLLPVPNSISVSLSSYGSMN